MKKIIQAASVLIVIIIITVGYISGNAGGEKHVALNAEAKISIESGKQLKTAERKVQQTKAALPDTNIKQETVTKSAMAVSQQDIHAPMVAITFDDGPHPKYSLEIAEALKKHGAVATFFVLGSRAEKYKSTIAAIAKNGNEIGNHTYSHKELTRLKKTEIINELGKTSDILKDITGVKPVLIRPAYGSVNDKVRLYAGSPLILWSIDTLDWKTRDTEKIIHKTLNEVKDGDIILMHDIYGTTAKAAEVIIRELKARGYRMVTVSQLYKARGTDLKPGRKYDHCTSGHRKK